MNSSVFVETWDDSNSLDSFYNKPCNFLFENNIKGQDSNNNVTVETLAKSNNSIKYNYINLIYVFLGSCKLNALSPAFSTYLTNLKYLDLSNNNFTVFPNSILKLVSLNYLKFSQNFIRNIPLEIYNLKNLKYLDISKNELSELPSTIGKLKNLRTLKVFNNFLTHLSPSIGFLINLEYIDLSQNQLKNLPTNLPYPASLQYVDISDNNLCALPEVIKSCFNLEILLANKNEITDLPKWLLDLKKIKKLTLNCNKLTIIFDKSIVPNSSFTNFADYLNEQLGLNNNTKDLTLSSLLYLNLNMNKINLSDICKFSSIYPNLQFLDIGNDCFYTLAHNYHFSFPNFVLKFRDLTNLSLKGLHLSLINEEISNLTNLQRLNLSTNNLILLPESICRLNKLTHLDVSHNDIQLLPFDLGYLVQLKHLRINKNQLQEFPDSFVNLQNLEYLDASYNPIYKLSQCLDDLCSLKVLVCQQFQEMDHENETDDNYDKSYKDLNLEDEDEDINNSSHYDDWRNTEINLYDDEENNNILFHGDNNDSLNLNNNDLYNGSLNQNYKNGTDTNSATIPKNVIVSHDDGDTRNFIGSIKNEVDGFIKSFESRDKLSTYYVNNNLEEDWDRESKTSPEEESGTGWTNEKRMFLESNEYKISQSICLDKELIFLDNKDCRNGYEKVSKRVVSNENNCKENTSSYFFQSKTDSSFEIADSQCYSDAEENEFHNEKNNPDKTDDIIFLIKEQRSNLISSEITKLELIKNVECRCEVKNKLKINDECIKKNNTTTTHSRTGNEIDYNQSINNNEDDNRDDHDYYYFNNESSSSSVVVAGLKNNFRCDYKNSHNEGNDHVLSGGLSYHIPSDLNIEQIRNREALSILRKKVLGIKPWIGQFLDY